MGRITIAMPSVLSSGNNWVIFYFDFCFDRFGKHFMLSINERPIVVPVDSKYTKAKRNYRLQML